MWDFEDVDSKVTIFHIGNHTCDTRKLFQPSSEIFEKFTRGGNITATKVAKESITVFFKEETPSWRDIFDVTDAGLERKNYIMLRKNPNGKLGHTDTAWRP